MRLFGRDLPPVNDSGMRTHSNLVFDIVIGNKSRWYTNMNLQPHSKYHCMAALWLDRFVFGSIATHEQQQTFLFDRLQI